MNFKPDPTNFTDSQLLKSVARAKLWAIENKQQLEVRYNVGSISQEVYLEKLQQIDMKLSERLQLLGGIRSERSHKQWLQHIEDTPPKSEKQLLIQELFKAGKPLSQLKALTLEELRQLKGV